MITDKDYYQKEHHFIFGVYDKGDLMFEYKRTKCSHAVAAIIVGILSMAKGSLEPGHYFACDLVKEIKI
jgi:hypothetical protein